MVLKIDNSFCYDMLGFGDPGIKDIFLDEGKCILKSRVGAFGQGAG